MANKASHLPSSLVTIQTNKLLVRRIAEGDLVAAHVRMTGTHAGPFGAIAPTGKVLTLTGGYHCRIVDGKLVEDWDSWTVLPLYQQTVAVRRRKRLPI